MKLAQRIKEDLDPKFGTPGIWHKPASERTKARDVPAVILERVKGGLLYIFTLDHKQPNLTYRTATIFPSEFTEI